MMDDFLSSQNRKLKIIELEKRLHDRNHTIKLLTQSRNHYFRQARKYRFKLIKALEDNQSYFMLEEKKQDKRVNKALQILISFFLGVIITAIFIN